MNERDTKNNSSRKHRLFKGMKFYFKGLGVALIRVFMVGLLQACSVFTAKTKACSTAHKQRAHFTTKNLLVVVLY